MTVYASHTEIVMVHDLHGLSVEVSAGSFHGSTEVEGMLRVGRCEAVFDRTDESSRAELRRLIDGLQDLERRAFGA